MKLKWFNPNLWETTKIETRITKQLKAVASDKNNDSDGHIQKRIFVFCTFKHNVFVSIYLYFRNYEIKTEFY